MSRKYRSGAAAILSGYVSSTAQSASFASDQYDVTEYSNYAFQVDVSSASGLSVLIKVQESLNGTTWEDVPGSSITVTANGPYIFRVAGSAVIFARLYFDYTAGAGSALYYALGMAKDG